MIELLTAAQMRAIETAAIESGAVTGLELMERAGRGVVEAIWAEWPELKAAPHSAVVLCGPGNNGGDGFVIARLLHDWGWEVDVFLYGDPDKLPPDARVSYERWRERGEVWPLSLESFQTNFRFKDRAIAVDALFGTGLTRPLPKEVCSALNIGVDEQISPYAFGPKRTVSVDAPSGLCLDSGRALGTGFFGAPLCVRADLTVSFHQFKCGHCLGDGPRYCGSSVLVDIGLTPRRLRDPEKFVLSRFGAPLRTERFKRSSLLRAYLGARRELVQTLADVSILRPRLVRTGGHKYDHGHALILSGPMGRSGAARLAARGALRSGAGLVTVAAPVSAMMECAAQLTAIMLRRSDGAEGLGALLEDARLNALCLGPGLGVGPETREVVTVALRSGRAAVLDADALTSFEDAPETLFALTQGTDTVLTPHGGEFAKLFPDIAEKLAVPPERGPAYSKVDAAREAAARAGCVVLFKGPDTVIADPDGHCAINAAVYDRAAPWLATAGSGDVLAGIVTGLLARGLDRFSAAEAAAWLHVEAARHFGPGLIAEDLPEQLPAVLRALEDGGP